MCVEELRPGLWWWTAPHPDWKPESDTPTGWGRDVSSYAVEAGDGIVLIDPLAPPAELAERAIAVAVTCEWHERDSAALTLPVYQPGSTGEPPPGIEAKPTYTDLEIMFWIPEHRAMVFGDIVSVREGRPSVNWTWVEEGHDESEIAPSLRPLLDLPVELILPGHGEPVTGGAHAALAAALER